MARKRLPEEPEQSDRWLISYADFITLLFAFFVVMYAISSVHEGKYRVFSESLGSAFGGSGARTVAGQPQFIQLPDIIQRRRLEAQQRERERLARISTELTQALGPLVKAGKVRITQTEQGITVDIDTNVLFDEGDAALQLDALDPLRQVGAVLKNEAHAVQVEGHTDTTPIATPRFASNWELSAIRAGSVVRLLSDSGIAPARLTVLGYGDTRPLASNATAAGRARNRRVAITILSKTLPP